MSRRNEVAALAGVRAAEVRQVAVADVRQALADRVPEVVLDVATQEPATYWLAGGDYWLDDPMFGDPVRITDLDYSSDLGLHVRRPQ
jgi:hypothetical protein